MFPSTALEKSEMVLSRFELLSVKLLLILPTSLGIDVCVGWTGIGAEAKTMDATGFQRAILDMSCCIYT